MKPSASNSSGILICGIDPGLRVTGYAFIRKQSGSFTFEEAGICRTRESDPLPLRLARLGEDVGELLEERRPDCVAIERLYAHYRHPRTAILMGHARGVMLGVAGRLGIGVKHFNATQVKRSLTGNGRAGKGQVQRAVMVTLGLHERPEPPDVADAIAIALCCALDVKAAMREVAHL